MRCLLNIRTSCIKKIFSNFNQELKAASSAFSGFTQNWTIQVSNFNRNILFFTSTIAILTSDWHRMFTNVMVKFLLLVAIVVVVAKSFVVKKNLKHFNVLKNIKIGLKKDLLLQSMKWESSISSSKDSIPDKRQKAPTKRTDVHGSKNCSDAKHKPTPSVQKLKNVPRKTRNSWIIRLKEKWGKLLVNIPIFKRWTWEESNDSSGKYWIRAMWTIIFISLTCILNWYITVWRCDNYECAGYLVFDEIKNLKW